jgi:hypothetical protein
MNKALKVFCLIVVAVALTSVAAQDELTAEQQEEQCAAEGGCAVFTRAEFMGFMRSHFEDGYSRGVQSCAKAA